MFSAVVIVLLTGVSLTIYFFSADYREDDFYRRLKNKAVNAAQLLIEVEEVDANLLKKIERDNPVNLPNERIIIYDYKNEELYSSDTGDEIKIDSAKLNEIRLQKEIRFRNGDYEVLGFLFTEKFDRITVVSAAIDTYGNGKLRNLRNILLFVFLISIVIVPISGWIYSGRALSPIFNLVRQTEKISAAQLSTRLFTNNKKDEIGKLVQTFNHMLDRLEKAFLAQKHFIANASHELRTPLTSITGEIEVTLIQPRAAEKYQEILRSVLEEIKSLSLLSNQLLLLAQTSTDATKQKLELQRVDELLWQVKDELLKNNPEYKIEIDLDVSLDDDSLTVLGDEQLLKTAFSNLIDNGCKYSDNNLVMVRLKSIRDSILIEFENHGMGIDPRDLTTIFQPFFRGNNTRNLKGHGIGLSLVHRIIGLHEGDIEVISKMGSTTLFTLSIPVA
ncbi:MAG: HAMP domain-containing protein [Bacteroidia bacterium]|nr:HAMP domain-containing protein [Bacteroidia bacterium]